MQESFKDKVNQRSTMSDRISIAITRFVGSIAFVVAHVIIFAAWIIYNVWRPDGFDPYPFGFLTLAVSLEAIFLSTFVMIAQNLENKQTEIRSELDYRVNVKAEREVARIHNKLDKLELKLDAMIKKL
jgi:uncharacterized membrane protein